jgi:hypothetical protein
LSLPGAWRFGKPAYRAREALAISAFPDVAENSGQTEKSLQGQGDSPRVVGPWSLAEVGAEARIPRLGDRVAGLPRAPKNAPCPRSKLTRAAFPTPLCPPKSTWDVVNGVAIRDPPLNDLLIGLSENFGFAADAAGWPFEFFGAESGTAE